MNLTITDLDKQAQERIAKKAELKRRIEELEKLEATATEKAQAAAENGDVEAYKASSTECQEIGTKLIVAKAQLSKIGSGDAIITQEEAVAVWDDYAKEYNKAFDKLYSGIEKKRNELLASIREMIELQEKAFADRERLVNYAAINTHVYTIMDQPYDRVLPCKYLPEEKTNCEKLHLNGLLSTNADILYYLAWYAESKSLSSIDFIQNSEVSRVKNIIERHTTKPY